MLEINQDDTFMLAENIFLQKISELEKYWAFNIDTGEHYTLNETSCWVLEQIAKNLPDRNILKDFLSTFDVNEPQGRNDFNEIVRSFLKEKIIKRRAER